jgi:hypothetical protein
VTVVEPTGKHFPDWCEPVTEGVPQLSVAVGAIQRATTQESALFDALNEILAGQFLITGLIESLKQGLMMVTVKLHTDVLPRVSFAVYVTVVKPILKHVPDGLDTASVGTPQLSVTEGAVHVAFAQLSAVLMTIFAGQFLRTGLVVSLKQGFVTVTLKAQRPLLLLMSKAV